MSIELKTKIAQKVAKALQIGELDPCQIGKIEAKIGFPLNLNEVEVAWAKRVWENRQQYRLGR
jgi:hypothetical protein